MAYHDDLLSLARSLVGAEPANQAMLRRAVSSAYYAVFHLLISEATSNWANVKARAALGRAFDHGTMRAASERIVSSKLFPYVGEDPQVVAGLRTVGRTFFRLQGGRHFADYNFVSDLAWSDAIDQVAWAEEVFAIWPSISRAQITQDYLVSLFVKTR
ncbi:MAG: hypothetical protein NTV52_25655 [Acidobacteria bacterium]|nr:hypothetical protein [Acidobacteriota bacterium]